MEKVSDPKIPGDGCLPMVAELLGLAIARLGRGEDRFVQSLIETAILAIEFESGRLNGVY